MLQVPAPWPMVGSYGLLVPGRHHAVPSFGPTELVRIQQRNAEGTVLISFPDRFGATGNMTVPVGALQDGTPLGDEAAA